MVNWIDFRLYKNIEEIERVDVAKNGTANINNQAGKFLFFNFFYEKPKLEIVSNYIFEK